MKIDQNTVLYGVIGKPVRHSLGPVMHNAAFSALGINAVYLAFEAEDIGASHKRHGRPGHGGAQCHHSLQIGGHSLPG